MASQTGFKQEFRVVTLRLEPEGVRLSHWHDDGRLAFDVSASPGDPRKGFAKFVDQRTESRRAVLALSKIREEHGKLDFFVEEYKRELPGDEDIGELEGEREQLKAQLSAVAHLSGLARCTNSDKGVYVLDDPDEEVLGRIDPNKILPLWVAHFDDVDPRDRVVHMVQCPLGWTSPPISRAGTGSHAVIAVGHSVDFRVISPDGVLQEVVALHVSGSTSRCYPTAPAIPIRVGVRAGGGRNGNGRVKTDCADPPMKNPDSGAGEGGGNGQCPAPLDEDSLVKGIPIEVDGEPPAEPEPVEVAVDGNGDN